MVLIGVPDRAGLAEAIRKISQWGHGYYAWFEPDFDLGLTAVATVPLDREAKKLFSNYALWRPIYAPSSAVEQSAALKAVGRSVVQIHRGVPTSNARLA